MTNRLIALVAPLLVCGALAQRADAQRADSQGKIPRIPVTIALLERLPEAPGELFLVRRSASADTGDVILLRADAATPKTLEAALHTLLTARQAGGDLPVVGGAFRIRPAQGAGAAERRRVIPWAARALADLRRAAPRDVPGVGRVRAIQLWLPSQHGGRGSGGNRGRSSQSGH